MKLDPHAKVQIIAILGIIFLGALHEIGQIIMMLQGKPVTPNDVISATIIGGLTGFLSHKMQSTVEAQNVGTVNTEERREDDPRT